MDRRQAERLVNTYSDLILRLSYTYLKSTADAQDICQTVFLKLLTNPRSFESPEHEKAWIIRATANACKDLLKSHWRRTTVAMDAAAPVPAPPAEEGIPHPQQDHYSQDTDAGQGPDQSFIHMGSVLSQRGAQGVTSYD